MGTPMSFIWQSILDNQVLLRTGRHARAPVPNHISILRKFTTAEFIEQSILTGNIGSPIDNMRFI